MLIIKIAAIIIIIGVFIYTASFGAWVWRRNKKAGSIAVYIIDFVMASLSIYEILSVR